MNPVSLKTRLQVMALRWGNQVAQRKNERRSFSSQVMFVCTSAGRTKLFVFTPEKRREGYIPVFVNMHGGGFVLGSPEDDNGFCQNTANSVNCMVINIEYKLAPEHRFPIALEECYDVIRWICGHSEELGINKNRIAVGGHSAGANLAAAICLLARERKEFTIKLQILNCPPLDLCKDPAEKKRVPAGSNVIPPKKARLFNECYIGSAEDARNPLVSPIYEKDLQDLTPALVITAERDSLAEQGELYAKRLKSAGVPMVLKQFAGVEHEFTMQAGKESLEAWDLINRQLAIKFL
jgi:acetyl esterase